MAATFSLNLDSELVCADGCILDVGGGFCGNNGGRDILQTQIVGSGKLGEVGKPGSGERNIVGTKTGPEPTATLGVDSNAKGQACKQREH